MSCFPSGVAAVQACLELQVRLLEEPWPAETLEFQETQEEFIPETGHVDNAKSPGLLWRGLRAKCGIFEGLPTSIEPHKSTGRADYFGLLVNRAARFMGCAFGGQVIAETEALKIWQDAGLVCSSRTIGKCGFKGVCEPFEICCVLGDQPIYKHRVYPTGLDGKKAWFWHESESMLTREESSSALDDIGGLLAE